MCLVAFIKATNNHVITKYRHPYTSYQSSWTCILLWTVIFFLVKAVTSLDCWNRPQLWVKILMKLTKVFVCHPILYSFVSWRAGGCWGGGETRIPRLSVQQEEKRVARKGCKGVRRRVAGGEGKRRQGDCARSSHDQYTGSRWGGCEKRLCFSWHGTPRSWLFYHWDPASVLLSHSLDACSLHTLLACRIPPSPPFPSSKPYLTTPYILQTCRPCPAYLQSLFNQICDNFRYNTAWMDGRERRDCMTE